MTADCVVQTVGISKIYRSGLLRRKSFQALKEVSLNVPRGMIFGLLGPNGAGKTTLIKILLGIVRKTGGTATVLGAAAGSMAARRQIGYLPENHRIPRHLTANTALEYYGGLSGMKLSEIRRESPRLLELVGLKGRENDQVSGYSKGMLQRLGLAQAILHRPKLVVLDEPTDGVDPVGRREIRDVLRKLAAEGQTIFLNSHLLQEIELICDSVAILDHGQLLKTGSVRELTSALSDAPLHFHLAANESAVRAAIGNRTNVAMHTLTPEIVDLVHRPTDQADVDQLIDELRRHQISILRMARREQTLEEVFMSIVGGGTT
jgi:ABC-2 type transport system ATP-binding protein